MGRRDKLWPWFGSGAGLRRDKLPVGEPFSERELLFHIFLAPIAGTWVLLSLPCVLAPLMPSSNPLDWVGSYRIPTPPASLGMRLLMLPICLAWLVVQALSSRTLYCRLYPVPKATRRRQFSLRTLLIVMIGTAVLLGWMTIAERIGQQWYEYELDRYNRRY